MRNKLILTAVFALSGCWPTPKIEIRQEDAGVPGVTVGVPWERTVRLASIPRYDYAADRATTDVVPGLRLDAHRVLVETAYVHEPRKDALVVKDVDGKNPVKAVVLCPVFGPEFSVLKTAEAMPGPDPLFSKRDVALGEDLHVGPYGARVYSTYLQGDRYRRFTVVFLRDDPQDARLPYPCVPGVPISDGKDQVVGVTVGYGGRSNRFLPPGYDGGSCEALSVRELLDDLKWIE